MEENPNGIRVITHNISKGIGASFWDGVRDAKGNIVCMMPGDNEIDPAEINKVIQVNPGYFLGNSYLVSGLIP